IGPGVRGHDEGRPQELLPPQDPQSRGRDGADRPALQRAHDPPRGSPEPLRRGEVARLAAGALRRPPGEAEVAVVAQFLCRMAMPTGEIVERMFAAESEAALRRELEEKDFLLLNVRRRNPALETLVGILRFRPRISSREFLFFNQEFGALIRAGLPILT